MKSSYRYTLFADYFQFYLQDETVEGDLSDAWTQETVENLLATAPGTIGALWRSEPGGIRTLKKRSLT